MNKKPVIYYGTINYAIKKLDEYIKITGEPVAFIRDKRWDNFQGDKVNDKYDVITLDEAIEQYPDAEIWMTYMKVGGLANEISKKISPERIHFLEDNLEYKKGCNFLGHYINYGNDHYSVCCITTKGTSHCHKGTISERFKHWQEYSEKLIDDIKNNRENACSNCHFLQYGFWQKEIKIDKFVLASSHPGDICNLRCIYCLASNKLDKAKKIDDEKYSTYEILKQLSEMSEYNTPKFTVHIANGEPCACKYQDKIFDILLKQKWSIEVISNMTIYREKFAKLMETGRVKCIITSPDAGTRETYKKIKQVDCFDKFKDNLKKYPLDKVKSFQMKYIFLDGINDNIEDIEGFYHLAKEVSCKKIAVSSDCFKPFTKKIRDLVLELIKKAKADNILVYPDSYLAPEDRKFINESILKISTEYNSLNSEAKPLLKDYKFHALSYSKEDKIKLVWEKSYDTTIYRIYTKNNDNYVKYADTKENFINLYHTKNGDTIKIDFIQKNNNQEILLKSNIVSIDTEFSSEKLCVITNVKNSSVDLYWNKIKNADSYDVLVIEENEKPYIINCKDNYLIKRLNNYGKIQFLVQAKSNNNITISSKFKDVAINIIKEIYYTLKNKNQIIAMSNIVEVPIQTFEINCFTLKKQLIFSWNKIPSADKYGINIKNEQNEYVEIATTKENIFKYNFSSENIDYEFKIIPYDKENNICNSVSPATLKVKPDNDTKINLTIFEAYNNQMALSWTFDGSVSGFDIYKNGKLYKTIDNKYAHIEMLTKQKGNFQIKGYNYLFGKKVYTVESNIAKLKKIRTKKIDKYKLSVVIPAYNCAKYVPRTISTILGSTLNEIEIILVNDGSTDDTKEILSWYKEKYPNNIKILNKENSGVADTRNKGIELATGEYLTFMDNDDMIRPDFYLKAYNSIKETGADIIAAPTYMIEKTGYILRASSTFKVNQAFEAIDFLKLFFKKGGPDAAVWNKLYKTELVKQHHLGVLASEDFAFAPYIASWADKICYIDIPGYEWDRIIRKETLSTNMQSHMGATYEKRVENRQKTYKFFRDKGNPKYRECLVCLMARRAMNLYKRDQNNAYINDIKQVKSELINNKYLLEDEEYREDILNIIKGNKLVMKNKNNQHLVFLAF